MRRWSVGDAWEFGNELAWRRQITVESFFPTLLSAGDIIY